MVGGNRVLSAVQFPFANGTHISPSHCANRPSAEAQAIVAMGISIIWFERMVVFDRIVQFALIPGGVSQSVVSFGKVGFERERLAVAGDGFIQQVLL